jgi:hypothetical protein
MTAWFQVDVEDGIFRHISFELLQEIPLGMRLAKPMVPTLCNYFVLMDQKSPDHSSISDFSSPAFRQRKALHHEAFHGRNRRHSSGRLLLG